jgi:hypothetical protein
VWRLGPSPAPPWDTWATGAPPARPRGGRPWNGIGCGELGICVTELGDGSSVIGPQVRRAVSRDGEVAVGRWWLPMAGSSIGERGRRGGGRGRARLRRIRVYGPEAPGWKGDS